MINRCTSGRTCLTCSHNVIFQEKEKVINGTITRPETSMLHEITPRMELSEDQSETRHFIPSISATKDTFHTNKKSSVDGFIESQDTSLLFGLLDKQSSIRRVPTELASIPRPSLLQEAVECLAQSNLIFLLANLRLLSATGRLFTKFEMLNIDSDFVRKHTAASLTGTESHELCFGKGISPAQTIAVLLIELRKELIATRQNGTGSIPKATGSILNSFYECAEETLQSKDDSLFSTMVDPAGRKETTNNMDKALQISAAMIGRDLKNQKPEISGEALLARMQSFIARQNNMLKFTSNRKHTYCNEKANLKYDDSDTDSSRISLSRSSNTPVESETLNEMKHDENIANSKVTTMEPMTEESPLLSSIGTSSASGSLGASKQTFKERRQIFIKNVQEHVGKVPITEEAKYRQTLESLVIDFFGVGVSLENIKRSLIDRTLTEAELLDIMERAVQSRSYEESLFMAEFFKEGTVSRALVQSKSKVVWLNDWYPLKDLTYAVSVDEGKKRVMVVFRGAITTSDWGAATDNTLQRTPNPVKDNFKGKKAYIKFHRGFFLYLFRRRKDTETCKYDEIITVVDRYGRQIADDNYEVFVTGHSLGGALATVFSFFASTEERFIKSGPIKCITFGAPMVGGYAFADSFRFQEQKRKLMLARFHNSRDLGEWIFVGINVLRQRCIDLKQQSLVSPRIDLVFLSGSSSHKSQMFQSRGDVLPHWNRCRTPSKV